MEYRYPTLRYLVLSYVTRPTTIRAMTEIPANTPRPIGRTDSFFPGISNAAVADPDASAAAADAEATESEAATVDAADVADASAALEAAVPVGIGTDETPFKGQSVSVRPLYQVRHILHWPRLLHSRMPLRT